jgi:hypothetical protein
MYEKKSTITVPVHAFKSYPTEYLLKLNFKKDIRLPVF